MGTVDQPYRIPARLGDFDTLFERLQASPTASAG
jgi:hypothetical protein